MYIGYTGSVTVSISSGAVVSNSASQGAGGIAVNRGTLIISSSRVLGNAAGTGAGAIAQFDSGAPVSVTVANSCIAGNGPLTSVVNASSPTIDARGNWWGAADGPSGAGPGSGDSVSSGVDFSGFLSVPPVPGCPAPGADLSVTLDGTGAGSVSSTPSGIDCGVDCSETFYLNTVVTLTATPNVSSTFAGWTGACAGSGVCVVTITESTQVTATFTLNLDELDVGLAGNGSGNVSSAPSGIDCGGTCNHQFVNGTVVTLTATPSASSTFAGWTGACGGTGACVIAMTQPAQVTATFQLNNITLSVAAARNGNGIVTSIPPGINCGSACSSAFGQGAVVTLTATPSTGSTFAGWSGACAGGGCVVTITQPAQVTATFSLNAYTLTVRLAGSGSGAVTSLPAGIHCGNKCSSAFNYGTVVTLTAKPAESSKFAGWQGACAGLGACVINVTGTTVVTATFSQKGHNGSVVLPSTGKSTIYGIAMGRNCGQICAAAFTYGTISNGTAAPAEGSSFARRGKR
jgi:hypothetical protein